MKKISKIFRIVLLAIICLMTFTATACDGNKKKEPKDTLALNSSEISMIVGDNLKLVATHNDNDKAELNFVSSNQSIVTVDSEGELYAVKPGSATITATFGNAKPATCQVEVGLGGYLPQIKFTQTIEDEMSVMLNSTFDLSAKVLFNGKTFDADQVDYSVQDTEVGTVENGIFQPKKEGETQITITVSWNGVETDGLTRTINMEVKDVYEVYVNDGSESSFTLYTINSFAGNSYAIEKDFVVTAKNSLNQDLSKSITVKEGDDVVEYSDGKIIAKKQGSATIEIVVTGGTEKTYTYPITVIKPEVEYSHVLDFSVMDGVLPIKDLFWEDAVLTKAYSLTDDAEIQVEDNLLTNAVQEELTAPKTIQLKLETATATRILTIKAYTKILKAVEDLEVFEIKQKGSILSGYFYLADDIDATSWGGNNHNLTTEGKSSANEGFFGTLDLNGKKLKLNMTPYGLFGNMKGGSILNGVIELTEKAGSEQAYGLAYGMGGSGDVKERVTISGVDFVVEDFGAGSANGENSAVIGYHLRNYMTITDSSFTVNAVLNAVSKTSGIITQKRDDWSIKSGGVLYVDDLVVTTNIQAPLFTSPSNCNAQGVLVNYWASNDNQTHDLANGSFVLDTPYYAYNGSTPNSKECTGATRELKNEVKAVDIEYLYSADDGNFVEDITGDVFTLETILEDLEISSFTIESSGVSYTDGVLSGITVGQDAVVASIIINDGTSLYLLKFKAYTKVINEPDDLGVFKITSTSTLITGYFYLSNDINATSWAGNNHTLTTAGAGSANEGFKGTFDMAGHTVSISTSKHGLFGNVNYAVIKNGKFIITEKSGSTQAYGLAYCMGGSGDYAGRTEIKDVDFVVNDFGIGSVGGDSSAVIGYRHEGWLYLTDCHFTINAVLEASSKTTGLITQIRKDWSFYTTNGVLFVNNVVVKTNSTAPLFTIPANQNGKNILVNYWASNDGKTHSYNDGSYVLSNPYTANDGKQCTGATRDLYEVKTIDISDTYLYSVDDGYFVQKGTGTVFNLASLVAEELEIENYSIATDGVSYASGVLSGITENGVIVSNGAVKLTSADSNYWTTTQYRANTRELRTTYLTLSSGDNKYTLEFYAYTKVLNEAEDFSVLDFNSTANKYVCSYTLSDKSYVRLNGFFALSNNIAYKESVAGLTHSSAIAQLDNTRGFRGVFDGNGYSAELNVGYRGVFGNITGALIQNVTFKLHLPASGGFGLAVQSSGENWDGHTYCIDMNVEIMGDAPTASNSAALFRNAFHTLLTLKNVNVTIRHKEGSEGAKATGLLIVWLKGYASSSTPDFTNVNVYTNATTDIVSKVSSAADESNVVVGSSGWANNDNKTADTTNFVLTGVTRNSLPA